MENGPVANGDVVAHGHVVACVAVKDAVVLDVRKGADGDLLLVGPEDGIVPHVGLFAQGHVTPEIGTGSHPGRGMKVRHSVKPLSYLDSTRTRSTPGMAAMAAASTAASVSRI